jgi:hypothetical protein
VASRILYITYIAMSSRIKSHVVALRRNRREHRSPDHAGRRGLEERYGLYVIEEKRFI